MQVKEAMKSPAVVAAAETALHEAARLMRDHKVGCLPVCDNGQLVGIVTDRDLVWRALADGACSPESKCSDVMAKPVVTCSPGDSLEEAARAMDQARVHHLPVLDADRRIAGVLSLGDLALKVMFSRPAVAPEEDALGGIGEMTQGIPEETLADGILRLAARDAWV